MKRSARTGTQNVFDELALKLREAVRAEHANSGSGTERFTVTTVDPLAIEQLGGDLTLEDGDPDVTVGAWVRQYMANYSLHVGDLVWALREGQEWHIVDVVDPGGQAPWMT